MRALAVATLLLVPACSPPAEDPRPAPIPAAPIFRPAPPVSYDWKPWTVEERAWVVEEEVTDDQLDLDFEAKDVLDYIPPRLKTTYDCLWVVY